MGRGRALATPRGDARELRQRIADGAAEKLLARTVVLTIVQLRLEGPRRHDVVLYEVSLGHLSSFTVDLPPGLNVEQAGTDEGTVIPIQEGQSLTSTAAAGSRAPAIWCSLRAPSLEGRSPWRRSSPRPGSRWSWTSRRRGRLGHRA